MSELEQTLVEFEKQSPAELLSKLVARDLDQIPLPGSGATLVRWNALAMVAKHDLGLAKLFEGHTDALAILAELAVQPKLPASALLGVWAADPPDARPQIKGNSVTGSIRLSGRKAWCSGARHLTHALMTVWSGGDGPYLALIPMDQAGVLVAQDDWKAVGMASSESVEVNLDAANATIVGDARVYLDRPGFWQGGAGVAACWYGGAVGLAEALLARFFAHRDDFLAAHLGAVDFTLSQTAALLAVSAEKIDLNPRDDARQIALRCRASAESCAEAVLHHVGRALGATPFCRDERFARRAADLPVFIRQSHAERDLAVLASTLGGARQPWELA